MVDQGYATLAVFLDLQRAFETIDRHLLIKKLYSIGLRGTVLQWFNNYLQDRQQRVKINGVCSGDIHNDYGVTQGSVLGPLLFVLYINDIVRVVDASIHLFADDTLVYVSGKNMKDIVVGINRALQIIYGYMCRNVLSINSNNSNKSQFMVVGPDGMKRDFVLNNFSIFIGQDRIEQAKKIKYLCVIVDDKLTFKDHANYVISKLSFSINFLSRCSSYLSFWSKLMIFLKHLCYPISITVPLSCIL